MDLEIKKGRWFNVEPSYRLGMVRIEEIESCNGNHAKSTCRICRFRIVKGGKIYKIDGFQMGSVYFHNECYHKFKEMVNMFEYVLDAKSVYIF